MHRSTMQNVVDSAYAQHGNYIVAADHVHVRGYVTETQSPTAKAETLLNTPFHLSK
jgi:hypothetical protein